MKSPIGNLLPFTSNWMAEKSGFPTNAAIRGVIRSFTSAVTTAPNAPPITTATARSMTLPRDRNCLKPFSMCVSSVGGQNVMHTTRARRVQAGFGGARLFPEETRPYARVGNIRRNVELRCTRSASAPVESMGNGQQQRPHRDGRSGDSVVLFGLFLDRDFFQVERFPGRPQVERPFSARVPQSRRNGCRDGRERAVPAVAAGLGFRLRLRGNRAAGQSARHPQQ